MSEFYVTFPNGKRERATLSEGAITAAPVVEDPKKNIILQPNTYSFTVRLNRKERAAVRKACKEMARLPKYVELALRDWKKGNRWDKMALKEKNPIRRGYVNHIAELKLQRSEMWARKANEQKKRQRIISQKG